MLTPDLQPWERLGDLATSMAQLDNISDDDYAGVQRKRQQYEAMVQSTPYLYSRFWADAWCAAFVWKKTSEFPYPITEEVFRRIERNPHSVDKWMRDEVERLRDQYHFLHWHLAFPDVFEVASGELGEEENPGPGWNGGFDVVLGNPPWERIKVQEKEWFAARRPEIAEANNTATRRRKIIALATSDPALYDAWKTAIRQAEGESHLVRNSQRFPLCGRGDVNTYSIFAETNRTILGLTGRVGCIVPSGIATDDTTKYFFQDLMETSSLVSLYDFENRKNLFDGVGHGRFKFCLLTLAGFQKPAERGAEFIFFAYEAEDLNEKERRFILTAHDLELLNPNTRTCPIFRSNRDAEITKAIYHHAPVLIREGKPEVNPWQVSFSRMLDMSNNSNLFCSFDNFEGYARTARDISFHIGGESYLPLYEAKMFHHFNHRYGDYADYPEGALTSHLPDIPPERLQDPEYWTQPRYWVEEWQVIKRISVIPKQIIELYEKENEHLLLKFLAYWFAGYHLNRGDEERGRKIVVELTPVLESLFSSLQKYLAVESLESEYPLTPEDLEIIQSPGDILIKARTLIEIRSPKWLMGWRKTCRSTDERTVIPSVFPACGVGDKCQLIFTRKKDTGKLACLISNLSSFICDYTARQKLGGTDLSYFLFKQLPILPPEIYEDTCSWNSGISLYAWLSPRILELTYTAWDLHPFAQDCGYEGPPFKWDEDRRFLLRCELDAAYFHLYGIHRGDVDYIMDTFPIVKRKDEKAHGHYRTKDTILQIYDAMALAIASGQPYQTLLDLPPADPRMAHPLKAS